MTPREIVRVVDGALRAAVRRVDALGWDVTVAAPSNTAVAVLVALQGAVWFALAAWILPARGHFTFDQAYFYEMSVRVAESGRFAGYGPFVSGVHPSPLTPGGLMYAVYAVPYLFGATDPRVGVAWMIGLSVVGVVLLERALAFAEVHPLQRLFIATLQLWSLWHARFSDTFWNANLFYFVAPLVFFLAGGLARAAGRAHAAMALGLGFACALATQIHLSGLMLSAMAVAFFVTQAEHGRLRGLALAAAAGALAYLPYLLAERESGGLNGKLLAAALPTGGFVPDAVWRTLAAPWLYVSHAQQLRALSAPPGSDWVARVFQVSLVVAGLLVVLGAVTRFRLRWLVLLMLLGLPLYFRLTGRDYHDHYVVALWPFFGLVAGAGLLRLWAFGRAGRVLALAAITFHVATGVLLVLEVRHRFVQRPTDPWNGFTVEHQLSRARQVMPVTGHAAIPSEDAFTLAVLTRRVLGGQLQFRHEALTCQVEIALTGLGPPTAAPPGGLLIPMANNAVYVCAP